MKGWLKGAGNAINTEEKQNDNWPLSACCPPAWLPDLPVWPPASQMSLSSRGRRPPTLQKRQRLENRRQRRRATIIGPCIRPAGWISVALGTHEGKSWSLLLEPAWLAWIRRVLGVLLGALPSVASAASAAGAGLMPPSPCLSLTLLRSVSFSSLSLAPGFGLLRTIAVFRATHNARSPPQPPPPPPPPPPPHQPARTRRNASKDARLCFRIALVSDASRPLAQQPSRGNSSRTNSQCRPSLGCSGETNGAECLSVAG